MTGQDTICEIDAAPLLETVVLRVRLRGWRFLSGRLWLATMLLNLAARIAPIDIVIEQGDIDAD
jgi:hypothetical protein